MNTQKSMIFFSQNFQTTNAQEISQELNMPITEDLGRYLRMPSIHGRVTKQTFQSIPNRVDKKVVGLKSSFSSMASRVTLIQSTISAIPNFSMQNAKIPHSFCYEVDRKAWHFLGCGTNNTKKVYNVSWDRIIKSKMMDGLRFKPM